MTSRRTKTPPKISARPSAITDVRLREHHAAGEIIGGWLVRPFTLVELVNVGVYVFINHRLKQYYVGQATTSFGVRFIREVGRRLADKPTPAGYDLVFDYEDSEIIYEKSYRWTEIRYWNLDGVEADVFNKYRNLYPDYAPLNKRNVQKWSAVQLSNARRSV